MIGTLFFDNNGNALPVSLATTISNHRNKFDFFINPRRWNCNSDPYRPFQQPTPPPAAIPEYRGEYSSRMQEWSYPRTRNQATNPAKFYANKLNETHAAFLADEIDLEGYISEVIAYLEHDHEPHTDVLAFLLTIQDKLESGSFCPEDARPKFATRLNSAWKAYQRKSGISPSPIEEQGLEEAILPDSSAPVVVAANKDAVISAHAGLVAGTVNQRDFLTTTRKFTFRRVSWRFKGTDQFGQTEDDIVQIAMVKMWDALPTFKDTSEGFFVWFRILIDNTVKDAKRRSLKESKRHAPFYVEKEDDEGKSEEVENPGIFGSIQFKRNGKVSYQEAQAEFRRELPAFIQGDDLRICQYIREDYNYARIAEILCMTENAVTKRVQKMAKEIEEMRGSSRRD